MTFDLDFGVPSVVLSFFYVVARRVLAVVVLRFRSKRYQELEIVVLRHELAVLRRQVRRPELRDADPASADGAPSLTARWTRSDGPSA